MIKRCLNTLVVTGLLINLTGCASWVESHNFIKKRRTEYLRSETAAPLQVPAGLNASGVGDDYIVPETHVPAPTAPIGILPPDSLVDKLARKVVTKDALVAASKIADAKPAAVNTQTSAVAATNTAQINNGLPLHQTSAQAWNSVGNALKRAGYKIAVADQKIASYYILDLSATGGKVTKATPIYQVKLQDAADGQAYALVTDDLGKPVGAEVSQKILTDLRDGLAGKGPSTASQMFAPIKHWFTEAF